MKTVLVTGDRNWNAGGAAIEGALRLNTSPGDTLIHGDARGVDRIAGVIGKKIGLVVIPVPADWDMYRKAAGVIRNRKMLDMKPDLVLAFHDNLSASKGTKDCVNEARRRGIPVVLYTSHGIWESPRQMPLISN